MENLLGYIGILKLFIMSAWQQHYEMNNHFYWCKCPCKKMSWKGHPERWQERFIGIGVWLSEELCPSNCPTSGYTETSPELTHFCPQTEYNMISFCLRSLIFFGAHGSSRLFKVFHNIIFPHIERITEIMGWIQPVFPQVKKGRAGDHGSCMEC